MEKGKDVYYKGRKTVDMDGGREQRIGCWHEDSGYG
jgi:hypothetical protein